MMSGNTWARSPGRRLAIAALLAATAGLVLTGCNDTNSSNTGPGYNAVNQPTGSVQGTVVDSNGNPLPGVKVTTGNLSTTTDSSGTYFFSNVPVSGTATQAGNASATGQFITLTLQPPAGYLGATVTLNAQSQTVAGGTQNNGGGSVTNPQVVFVSGYAASAGTAFLPATTGSITGTLRNGITSAALSGVTVYSQFIGGGSSLTQSSQVCAASTASGAASTGTGCSAVVTYAAGTQVQAITTSTGAFTLSGLPLGSCFSLYAPGYNFTAATAANASTDYNSGCPPVAGSATTGTSAATSNILISTANSPQALNQLYANPSANADKTQPWIVKVAGVVGTTTKANPVAHSTAAGQLNSTITNTLTVTFSVPMVYTSATATGNPVSVIVGTGANLTLDPITSIAFDSTNTIMTITLANNLPQGSSVLVNLPVESFADTNGNALTVDTVGAQFGSGSLTEVAYDYLITTQGSNNVTTPTVQLALKTFQPGNTQTGTFTVSQTFTAQNAAASSPTNPAFAFSSVLGDVVGTGTGVGNACNGIPNVVGSFSGSGCTSGSTTLASLALPAINQLNAQELPNPNVATVLGNLASQILGTATGVSTNVARVTVTLATPAQVADLAFSLTDAQGNPKSVLYFPVNTANGPNPPVAEGSIANQIGNVPTKAYPAAANNSTTPATVAITGTPQGNAWYGINPNGNATFDVILVGANGDSIAPGYLLNVVSRASPTVGTYLISNAQLLTLKDEVDPTVALQVLPSLSGASGTTALGAGGEIFTGGAAGTPGSVIFPVTPQLGDTSDAVTGNIGTATGYSSNSFVEELFNPSAANKVAGFLGAIAAPGTDSHGNARVYSDATGLQAYLTGNASAAGSLAVPVSMAVTEAVTVTGTPVYNGTKAALSTYGAAANVQGKLGTFGPTSDLVTFTVSNIFKLAQDGVGATPATINLTGAITDANGNVPSASDNAVAVVRDLFPPLMTRAYLTGSNYVFVFNEPVQLAGHLYFSDCGISLDLAGNNGATPPVPNATVVNNADYTSTVTVPAAAVAGNCFDSAHTQMTYAEATGLYTTADPSNADMPGLAATVPASSGPAGTIQHGRVSYYSVPDASGNFWDCESQNTLGGTSANPSAYCAGGSLPLNAAGTSVGTFVWAGLGGGMGSPRFLMANLIGPFGVSVGQTNFANNSTSFTVAITGTQPIYNFFAQTLAPEVPTGTAPIYVTNVPGTPAGTNPCQGTTAGATAACATFLGSALTLTSACTVGPTSTAALNGTNTGSTTLTFTIVCTAGTKVATGDTVVTDTDNDLFQSKLFDPNNTPNNFQSTTNVNGVTFTAN